MTHGEVSKMFDDKLAELDPSGDAIYMWNTYCYGEAEKHKESMINAVIDGEIDFDSCAEYLARALPHSRKLSEAIVKGIGQCLSSIPIEEIRNRKG